MNSKLLVAVFALVIVVVGATLFLLQKPASNAPAATFTVVSTAELATMLASKDFELIDVHIPEQEHVPGTDYLIPFNEIDKIVQALPDKDQKVVFYCRSGGMSRVVVEEMVKRGYTNVFDLDNGMNQWLSEGRDALSLGSVEGL